MKILVVSEKDDCYGPMAARFLNDFSDKVEAISAGLVPAMSVQPACVKLMDECFADMRSYVPSLIDDDMLRSADYIVLVGALSRCFSGENVVVFDMPKDYLNCDALSEMRECRDYVKNGMFVLLRSFWDK